MKKLAIGLGLVGLMQACDLGPHYVYQTGTVIQERYTPSGVREGTIQNSLDGNQKALQVEKSKYNLTVKGDDGKTYSITVLDGFDGNKEALDMRLEEGSRVTFELGVKQSKNAKFIRSNFKNGFGEIYVGDIWPIH